MFYSNVYCYNKCTSIECKVIAGSEIYKHIPSLLKQQTWRVQTQNADNEDSTPYTVCYAEDMASKMHIIKEH